MQQMDVGIGVGRSRYLQVLICVHPDLLLRREPYQIDISPVLPLSNCEACRTGRPIRRRCGPCFGSSGNPHANMYIHICVCKCDKYVLLTAFPDLVTENGCDQGKTFRIQRTTACKICTNSHALSTFDELKSVSPSVDCSVLPNKLDALGKTTTPPPPSPSSKSQGEGEREGRRREIQKVRIM